MDFLKMSLTELREYAKNKGIRNVSTLKKVELAELLSNVEKMLNKSSTKDTSRVNSTTVDSIDSTTVNSTTVDSIDSTTVKSSAVDSIDSTTVKSTTVDSIDSTTVKSSAVDSTTVNSTTVNSTTVDSTTVKSSAVDSITVDSSSDKKTLTKKVSEKENSEKTLLDNSSSKKISSDKGTINKAKSEKNNDQQADAQIAIFDGQEYNPELDSDKEANGILEVMTEGYGFIRSANYMPGDRDIYVSPMQIKKFGLKKGDILRGPIRTKTQSEKFSALLYIKSVNGVLPSEAAKRKSFDDMTPIFPNERISLDVPGSPVAIRIVDLLSPIGKGQRGMIVSPPKAGKTTLLKAIAKCISRNNKDMHMIVLLIDERPEEVTDIRESIEGEKVEVIYSTFDELPEHHKRVSEMVIERAKRLVEHKKDVVVLLDSITRLARAYNLTVPPSGRTLSGGLDPAALHMPKRFFGAARNMREGGSLTILATALVDTGSRMDDVVFEEFKGTGNMELVLDRKLSEKRIFPAIDIAKSGTRRDDLLLTAEEMEVVNGIHKALSGSKSEESIEEILKLFVRTKNNQEFIQYVKNSLLRK